MNEEYEIWLPLLNYNGVKLKSHYSVSNRGRIRSDEHSTTTIWKGKQIERHYPSSILTANLSNSGYYQIMLKTADEKLINVAVHRAVGFVFCTNDDPDKKKFVNHIDGNKLNNNFENLEWCTPSDNTEHAFINGLITLPGIRTPVKCLETGQIFDSLTSASLAMGRWPGYVSEKLSKNQQCTDCDGTKWTICIEPTLFDDTQPNYRFRVNCAIRKSKQKHTPKQLFRM